MWKRHTGRKGKDVIRVVAAPFYTTNFFRLVILMEFDINLKYWNCCWKKEEKRTDEYAQYKRAEMSVIYAYLCQRVAAFLVNLKNRFNTLQVQHMPAWIYYPYLYRKARPVRLFSTRWGKQYSLLFTARRGKGGRKARRIRVSRDICNLSA